jgi:hypothetical protein
MLAGRSRVHQLVGTHAAHPLNAIGYFAAVAAVAFLGTDALGQSGGSSSAQSGAGPPSGLANPSAGTGIGSAIGAGGNSRGIIGGSLPDLSAPPGARLGISPSCSPGSADAACREPLSCASGDNECTNTSGGTRRDP